MDPSQATLPRPRLAALKAAAALQRPLPLLRPQWVRPLGRLHTEAATSTAAVASAPQPMPPRRALQLALVATDGTTMSMPDRRWSQATALLRGAACGCGLQPGHCEPVLRSWRVLRRRRLSLSARLSLVQAPCQRQELGPLHQQALLLLLLLLLHQQVRMPLRGELAQETM